DPTSQLGRILDEQFVSLWSEKHTVHLTSAEELEAWLNAHSVRQSRRPSSNPQRRSSDSREADQIQH
ncbi:MAG TPA: hypothetical protein VMW75_22105, partial [Thermoanaerobaculia bacterium]|nr:hypothetical protein [Thermoanaerobaculia bacterium]